jgi:hypothetical protein
MKPHYSPKCNQISILCRLRDVYPYNQQIGNITKTYSPIAEQLRDRRIMGFKVKQEIE